jgi:RNA polymerase sigma-70 factor (ECF subfamily)
VSHALRSPPVTELPTTQWEDDAELVRRARGGDRWAEEALYRRHVRAVTNAVTRLLGRTADADDVVQDTFLRALERLEDLRDGAAFRSWVQRIAVTLCHRRFRKRKLLRAFGLDRGDDDATLEAQATEGARPDLVALLRQIDRELDRLSVASRSAWILHRVEGWTLEETADALEVSLATAKRRLAEADARIAPFREGSSEEGAPR